MEVETGVHHDGISVGGNRERGKEGKRERLKNKRNSVRGAFYNFHLNGS